MKIKLIVFLLIAIPIASHQSFVAADSPDQGTIPSQHIWLPLVSHFPPTVTPTPVPTAVTCNLSDYTQVAATIVADTEQRAAMEAWRRAGAIR